MSDGHDQKKLKKMSPAMMAVAGAVMSLRSDPKNPEIKASLTALIEAATPELVAAGFNVFNTGPALLAIEKCETYAGALVVHYELDKLRRMMGLEKPDNSTERGPGGR